jgi:predicted nucleic acid-binding protein
VRHLPDISVLFPLFWAGHAHHARCRAWFLKHRHEGWATCAETQLAFVRLAANPAATFQAPLATARSVALLAAETAGADHIFLPSLPPEAEFVGRATGHRMVQDFYLVQLAARAGAKVATADEALVFHWPQHTLAL